MGDWVRYWRAPDRPLEAMHAHFERHTYHRHSHETYSFGVTERGAQAFSCRGGTHTSAAGMVMAFNPDDAHDGRAADALGFTYRMVHIGPELVADVLADAGERPPRLPLFAEPVVTDAVLAEALRSLHRALLGDVCALRRDERLARAVTALAARGTGHPLAMPRVPEAARVADRAREFLDAAYRDDIGVADMAAVVGRSRFATARAFRASYGMAPSDYQRQLRIRDARRLLAEGVDIADAAAMAGFADQAHLTRWFGRYFGITPGVYRRSRLVSATR